MKNACLSLILYLMVSSIFAVVDKPISKPKSAKATVNHAIFQSIIDYPANIRGIREKEIVLIAFRIEDCGTIIVEESNSSNADLLDYVIAKINTAHLSVEELGDTKHYLKLTFLSR